MVGRRRVDEDVSGRSPVKVVGLNVGEIPTPRETVIHAYSAAQPGKNVHSERA